MSKCSIIGLQLGHPTRQEHLNISRFEYFEVLNQWDIKLIIPIVGQFVFVRYSTQSSTFVHLCITVC